MSKRNILFIECDSMDGRAMGCVGHPAVKTPHLDHLAERGALFRNTYCSSPQCCPSRSSRWSGKHTHVIEGWNNYKGLEPDERTYVSDLEDAGYIHQAYGKTDYLSGRHSLHNRISSWTRAANIRLSRSTGPLPGLKHIATDERRVHQSDWAKVEDTIAYLETRQADDRPFILHCSLDCPHPAFVSSQYYLDRIDPDAVTIPPYEAHLHPVVDYMCATKGCADPFTEDEIRTVRRTYFAMVTEVDEMVGEVMATVDRLGLMDSTYVLFASDHGEMNMEHRQHLKNAMYEASARVPLIVAGPDVRAGHEVDALVSLVDLYPTFMDMAELDTPDDLDGVSLIPELVGKRADRPDRVLCQYHSRFANTGEFMLRQGDLKYVAYAGYALQLFNLAEDPEEVEDLATKRPELAGEMDRKLREIVDYEAIDARAKAYDKASFSAWREEIGPTAYEEAMAGILPGWSDVEREMTEAWLRA